MNEIFDQFSSIILQYKRILFRQDSKITELKYRVIFINNSILEFTEIFVHDIKKRKYAFHWMDFEYNLLIRWDNALHHSYIPSFPYHKHVGDDKIVTESYDISLFDVLTEIENQIKS